MQDEKDIKIKELEKKLEEEISVKKSEVLLNKELLVEIQKLKLHNNTLLEINEDYSNKIAELKVQVKKIIYSRV